MFETTANQTTSISQALTNTTFTIDSTIKGITIINSGDYTEPRIFDPEGLEFDRFTEISNSQWLKVRTKT